MHFVGETDSNFFNKKFLCPDEGQDEYEKDGFIVDDVDEEEEQDEEERADSDEERQKKKKRKKKWIFFPLAFIYIKCTLKKKRKKEMGLVLNTCVY